MKDTNARQLLSTVMQWNDEASYLRIVPDLLLLSNMKYDSYQRFAPGRRFIESLALWLNQFKNEDKEAALDLIRERLVFISDDEMSHLVKIAYPDQILQERIKLVSEEKDIPNYAVKKISKDRRFVELSLRSLYLGLSDGARTNEMRRASQGEISNEQIWQAYELGEEKAEDMVKSLRKSLKQRRFDDQSPSFNLIWLIDDFSASGNTYIRYDEEEKKFKGKIKKIYERLAKGDLINPSHYEVYLLLYVATRQAVNHIEYWANRFTSEYGYKPLQIRVIQLIEPDIALTNGASAELKKILSDDKYYNHDVHDEHFEIGGTTDAKLGFASCALPIVLSHNTPNNSVFLLWGPESSGKFSGLFPRVSRHREF